MKLSTDLKPDYYLGLRANELLEQINATHRPVIITQNGEPRAVIQDAKSYELMRRSLIMLQRLAREGR